MSDETRECVACGGRMVPVGTIGFLEWSQCEDCGQDQSRRIGEFVPPEGWDDDDDEADDEADDDEERDIAQEQDQEDC
jgi:hypothetical protein